MKPTTYIESTLDTEGYCQRSITTKAFSRVLIELWGSYPLSLMERFVIKCVHQIGVLHYGELIHTLAAAHLGHVHLRDAAVALGRYYSVDIIAHPDINRLTEAHAAAELLQGGRLYSTSYIPKGGDFALYFENLEAFKSISERFRSEGAQVVTPTEPRRISI